MSAGKINIFSHFHPAPKAVIFDMDGTLIASTEADYLAWKKLFAEYGIDLTFEKYYPLLGKKSIDVISSGLQLKGDDVQKALDKKMANYREVVREKGISIIPGAAELIKYCKRKVPIALATSSRMEKMTMMMEMAGFIELFNAIVTGGEIYHGKPSPDIFLLTAKKLGIDPADCLVFEDAISGVQSAIAAGMRCIAITTTHTAAELSEADLIISGYDEISMAQH